MTAYYNEIHPGKAETLRNMITAGLIPAGDVDERSIEDVKPSDLAGYTQCHFFAGVGIWALALRAAGWPDHRPVWTGSCPCQPFSSAGKGDGINDERHLWPAWFHLIRECRPLEIYAEQVASKDGLGWLDLVQADMEGADYSGGFIDLCAAGFGAPHIRQRLYGSFRLADMHRDGQHQTGIGVPSIEHDGSKRDGAAVGLGNTDSARAAPRISESAQRQEGFSEVNDHGGHRLSGPGAWRSDVDGLGDAGGTTGERNTGSVHCTQGESGSARSADGDHCDGHSNAGDDDRPGPTNGFWRNADWLGCRDGKWRPVEPGSSPLAYGLPRSPSGLPAGVRGLAELAGLDAASLKRAKAFRKLALHSYGDGIVLQQAVEFIRCSQ